MDFSKQQWQEVFRWFIAFRNPKDILQNHWTYLVLECVLLICGILTLRHALKRGGRYPYLWLATVFHGLVVESLSYILPDVDNFWHAQSTVMLLGLRLPLHIVFIYPVLIYTACIAVKRMKLPSWVEPFAVGLAVVLLDVPFDIIGIKCLWWTWHDTDPNIHDRHYWVPWTSYYFHASFASSFSFIFHSSRTLVGEEEKFRSARFLKEIFCTVITALLATPLGILQFVFLYHSLHDLCGIHSEVCVLTFLTVYLLIVWTADRNPAVGARSGKNYLDEIFLVVLLLYATCITIVMTVRPEMQQSTGLHEPIGPCDKKIDIHTPVGVILQKRKYLCLKDYEEPYYDFHCVDKSKVPLEDNYWYTICGTPFPNRAEYQIVVSIFCLIGLCVYNQLLLRSGNDSMKFYKKLKMKTC